VVTTLIPPPGKGTFTCQPTLPHPLPSLPPRLPPSRHPQPQLGGHYETDHQGGSGDGHTASFPSLISLGLKGIILSCRSNKSFITLSFIVSSLRLGAGCHYAFFMALGNTGYLPSNISSRVSAGLTCAHSYSYALPGMSTSYCSVACSKFSKPAL
jgi:hypothetical protein